MNERLIYVSNETRSKSLQNQFSLSGNLIRPDNYLFVINNFTSKQEIQLKKITDKFKPLLQFVAQNKKELILKVLPESELFSSLQKEKINDSELDGFFEEVVKYFTKKTEECWKLGQSTLDFSNKPLIMGILNVTPDSFSDGGHFLEKQKAVEFALEMIEAGADIVDIGGESTRPGAGQVTVKKELDRVIPVIEALKKHTDAFISIDTYKSRVAKQALEAGADIINDVSGTVFDENMKSVIDEKKCPVILMHIKGMPINMQENPEYDDLHEEVYSFLQKKCAEIESLNNGKIIIDPGIGFGKSVSDNLKLLRDIKDFTFLNKPILIGVSRKSFIGRILDLDVHERLSCSLASEIYTFLQGAEMLRVHDVKETYQAKKLLNNILTVL